MKTTRDPTVLFFGNPWVSSEIRGRQVAKRGGWIFEPEYMRKDDIAVFIKSYPEIDFVEAARENNVRIFVDVVDCYGIVPFLELVPETTVIAISRVAKNHLMEKISNKVVLLPEHHCNFDDEKRNAKKLKKIGFIGYACNFQFIEANVRKVLKHFDIEFVMKTEFKTRQEIVDFYMSIDLQLCFRLPGTVHMLVSQMKNPLKLANAGSFGIPTIAYPEPSYVDEWDGKFFPIGGMDGLVHWVTQILEDWDTYKLMSAASELAARYYHIDKIVAMYKKAFDESNH